PYVAVVVIVTPIPVEMFENELDRIANMWFGAHDLILIKLQTLFEDAPKRIGCVRVAIRVRAFEIIDSRGEIEAKSDWAHGHEIIAVIDEILSKQRFGILQAFAEKMLDGASLVQRIVDVDVGNRWEPGSHGGLAAE